MSPNDCYLCPRSIHAGPSGGRLVHRNEASDWKGVFVVDRGFWGEPSVHQTDRRSILRSFDGPAVRPTCLKRRAYWEIFDFTPARVLLLYPAPLAANCTAYILTEGSRAKDYQP
jgi:hypothetical protein